LHIVKKILGEEHTEYATRLRDLGSLYAKMRMYSKSEPLLVQACEIKRKTVGEGHPDCRACLNLLAQVYRYMGKYAQAESAARAGLDTEVMFTSNVIDFLPESRAMTLCMTSTGSHGESRCQRY
jgi:hypothetical protein